MTYRVRTPTAQHIARALTAAEQPQVMAAATRCLVDWAGCAVAGSTSPLVDVLLAAQRALGTGAACTVVGRSGRAAAGVAALVNGGSSHVLDFDDVNVRMIGHPAVVVLPAAVALAEERGADGATMLRAVVAGYEIAEAIGEQLNPAHYEDGWHATATIGCAAAAVSGGVVLDLDVDGLARAATLALTQAGGVRAVFGSQGKGFHAGRAAMAGVLAAVLSEAGADVPRDVLDGPSGYLHAAGGEPLPTEPSPTEPSHAAPALRTAFKRHAACGATHCLIDAVAAIVSEHNLRHAQIASIEAKVHPIAVRAAGIREPATGLEAKFSLWHAAALAAVRYPLGPAEFADDTFAPPEVVDLRGRVTIAIDEGFSYEQAMPAAVKLTTTDGRCFDRFIDTPRGRSANPMSDDELDSKFSTLASPVLGAERASRALNELRAAAAAPSVASATACLVP